MQSSQSKRFQSHSPNHNSAGLPTNNAVSVTVHRLTVPSSLCCVCVCACVCVWVCLIEADSLQLRIIYRGYIRSCHAVLCCQILGLSAVSWPVVSVRSCFLISAVSWTLSPDIWPPIVSLRYLPQPCFLSFTYLTCFAINRSCFRNLNPPVFIYDHFGYKDCISF